MLPFELIQGEYNSSVDLLSLIIDYDVAGVTHATVWAAACSYITQHTELELRSSAQGVMQGIYHGLGRGSGSILGGVVIHRFGNLTSGLYSACLD